MRKLIAMLALAWAASGLYAAGQFGAALDMNLNVDGRRDGGTSGTQTDMTIVPAFIIKLDPTVQLEPFLGIGYHAESRTGPVTPNVPWGNGVSNVWLKPGAALYWFPAKADRWSFGTGAKLWFEFGPFVTAIEVPFIIEFALTENIHIRISQKIMGLNFTSGAGPGYDGRDTFNFTTFYQGFSPYFGFSFYF